MNPIIIVFLVGFLLLLGVTGLIALISAIRNAADGHEDETGFHFDPGIQPNEAMKRVGKEPPDHDLGVVEPVLF